MTTWKVTKSSVRGNKGMVAAQHWKAARAGARVLVEGGNAVDAAVTAAIMLAVVEPWLSGLGGGGFMLRLDGASGEADALNFNMISPAALDPARYALADGKDGDWFNWPSVEEDRNIIGYESICVPGAVAGFAAALKKFGTLSFADAIAPALAEAEQGLEVDWFTALCLGIDAKGLAQFEGSRRYFLEKGAAPRPAENGVIKRLPTPELANTLRRLMLDGADDFYHGSLAADMAGELEDGGSALSLRDLASYEVVWTTPARGRYRDEDILVMPGLSGGPTLLHILNLLEQEESLGSEESPTGRDLALYVDAIREGYEYRLKNVGHAGAGGDCTSHVSVIDKSGTAVSLTNTLLSRFGSKVTLPSTGLLMNNGMMWFDPRPGHANSIAAGKQPLANMCPVIAARNGKPWLALGAAGGRQIVPAVTQILSFLIDFGMDLETALHLPRIDASRPVIRVNRGAPSETASLLADRWAVEVVDDLLYPVQFAIPSAVACRETGALEGMVHPNNPWAAAVAEESMENPTLAESRHEQPTGSVDQ